MSSLYLIKPKWINAIAVKGVSFYRAIYYLKRVNNGRFHLPMDPLVSRIELYIIWGIVLTKTKCVNCFHISLRNVAVALHTCAHLHSPFSKCVYD